MAQLTTSWQTLKQHTIVTKVVFRLQGRYTSQDLTVNTTAVEYRTQIVVTGSGNYYESYGIASSINGTRKSIGHKYFSTGSTTTLQTLTQTITHANDGTYSGTVTTRYEANYGSELGTTSIAITLPTIPRGSTIAAVNATIGSATTITISPYVTTYYHTISYAFGAVGKTAIGQLNGTQKTLSWTPPLSLAAQIPKAWSGTGTVYVDTYSDAARTNLVGTKTASLTLAVPNYTMAIGNISAVAVDGISGNYAQGISKAKVTATATTAYGATIASYSVNTVAGTNGNPVTVGPFSSAGNATLTVRAVDSRGVSVSKATTIKIEPYSPPTLTSFVAYRVEASGSTEESDAGTWAYLKAVENHASVNGANTVTATATLSGATAASGNILAGMWYSGLAPEKIYTATVHVVDGFGNSASQTVQIPATIYIMDIKSDGLGIAFGKSSTKTNAVESGWPMYVDENLEVGLGKQEIGEKRISVSGRAGKIGFYANGHETGSRGIVTTDSNGTDRVILHAYVSGDVVLHGSAEKLGTITIGSTRTPIYIERGVPKACTPEDFYPVGTVIIKSTNTPPSVGTWQLVDKEFTPSGRVGTFTVNSTNCTSCAVAAQLGGHSLALRFTHVNKKAIGDTALAQGTLSPQSVGLKNFPMTTSVCMGASDGGNAITMWTMATDGALSSVDRDPAGNTTGTGMTTYIYMHFVCADISAMLDSFCGKFYFKRTA